MINVIYYGIMFLLAAISFLFGKYIYPHIPEDTIYTLEGWANKFVIWAQRKFEDKSGSEKMQIVVNNLKKIATEKNMNTITDDELEALVQYAYEEMMRNNMFTTSVIEGKIECDSNEKQ